MQARRIFLATVAAWVLGAALPPDAAAQSAAEKFYAGRRVDFIVGSAPGGGYYIYATVLARHLGQHIPGNPTVTMRQLDGAGSLVAANELYAKSPRDGSVFGAIFMGAVVEPLIGDASLARYDSRKFNFVGSANREASVCFAWNNVPIKDWSYVFEKELIVAGAGTASSINQYPLVLNRLLHTKFKIITGYPGSREAVQSVEKGESQGICGIQWSSFVGPYQDWMTQKKITLFGQIAGLDGDATLNQLGIPNLYNFVKADEDRQTLALIFGQMQFGRPYILPPQVPPDRVAALRAAFDETMKDPAFLAEAAKAKLPINPMSGAEVQQLVAQLYDTPKPLVERARTAMKP
jgi:tripartite-type tricarboxylate transporter receptor subunit TctC